MKQSQYLVELRALDPPELNERLRQVRTELFNLRFRAATGQLENHRHIREVRHQIAQVLTVIQGRALGLEEIVKPQELARETAAKPRRRRRGADAGRAEPEVAAEDETASATAVATEPGPAAAAAPPAEGQDADEDDATEDADG